MSADEIALAAQARQDQVKTLSQMMAWIAYNQAALTGVAINDPKHFPTLEDAFPSLFEAKENKQQDWRVMKDRITRYGKIKKETS